MKAFVVFGSKSDEKIYTKLLTGLKKANIKTEFHVLSAHRNPKELEKAIKKTNADFFIAGAGLSAALPGVVASQTKKPVFGLPLSGNYDGLDAFLSVHQMPKGIPVLASGIDNVKTIIDYVKIFSKKKIETFVLIQTGTGKTIETAVEKAEHVFLEEGVDFDVFLKRDYSMKNALFIDFIDINKINKVDNKGKPVLFVPVGGKTAKDSLKTVKLTKKGLWLGLARGENAAISALRLAKLNKKIKNL